MPRPLHCGALLVPMEPLQSTRKRKKGNVEPPDIQTLLGSNVSNNCEAETSKRARLGDDQLAGGSSRDNSGCAHWSVEEVVAFMSREGFNEDVCAAFKGAKIVVTG